MRRELGFALFCLLIYVISGTGVVTHVDGVVYYALARRMVDNATFSLDRGDPALITNPEIITGPDGMGYAHFNPGLPMLIAPLYEIGKVLSPWLPHVSEFTAADFLVSMTNAVVTTGAVLLVVLLVRELGYPLRAALLAGAALGFGSMTWNYATTLFTEPATGVCVLLSVLLLVRSRRNPRPAQLIFAAGLAAGGALLMRVSGLVFMPGLAVYLVLAHRRLGWRLIWLLAAFSLGCAVLVAATGWYNFARFGNVLETGYTITTNTAHSSDRNELADGLATRVGGHGLDQILYALVALLISPGRGVLLFAPVLILGLLGLPALARRWPLEAALLVVLSGSLLVAEAILPFDYWFGGWSYGPRYLVPMLGLGAVSAAAWFARVSRGPAIGLLGGGVLALMVALQLPTVLANVNTTYYRAQVARGTPLDHVYLVESWQASTYVGAWLESALVTQRTLRGQPVPRGRLGDFQDPSAALEQSEVLNTFQPWWLRLAQTGRLVGAARLGMFGLVGMLLVAAALALRVATGASLLRPSRRSDRPATIGIHVDRLEERGSA
ncbi:MAG: hypothetical protein ACR2IK_09900 [Chloroflexota bacterium]